MSRTKVWHTVGAVSLALVILLLLSVQFLPLPPVKPGNDYDISFKTMMITGFAYGATPGLAAILSLGPILFLPRKPIPS